MRARSTVRYAVFLLIALSLLSTRSRALVNEEKPESKHQAAAQSRGHAEARREPLGRCQVSPRISGDCEDVQHRQRILAEKRLSGLDAARSAAQSRFSQDDETASLVKDINRG